MTIKTLLLVGLITLSTALTGCATPKNSDDDIVTVYFARHGKTLFNTFDLVQGWADTPLTEQGIEVARYLGEGLKDIQFDAYYTSDAGRQRETMQVILQQMGVSNYHITELKGLREVFYGGYEGSPNQKIVTDSMKLIGYKSVESYFNDYKAGKLPIKTIIDPIAKVDPKGLAENYDQVKARTQAALNTIVDNAHRNGDKNILAVSSGMSMQVLIADLTDSIDKNKPLSNATVIKITYKNGQYRVDEIGSMAYVNIGKQRLTHP
ncbi:putative phosphoglycerate mutase [Orbus hercynius]|uniref:Putative phosphoglycerate mutase n=1 Tax=Orbus hercynius TaxID=593135 RepID=A0A495RJB7_9GAMM|nr:histidine phosphatase family protein [Orbus hercynius]RKS87390.1 putative phosphoglycerate mutase [Orbus hercynius]